MTTVQEETQRTDRQPLAERFDRLEYQLTRLLYLNGETIAYATIFLLAVVTRFWDLGVRVMSHDESLHTRYSWNLYQGQGFAHTPLMHGPLLFHMTALSYLLFGDSDFTSRIYPALVGIAVVMLPLAMRRWLGKFGALAASFFFLISPLILYYSRYIRHDMPAILGALIMAISIWRYMEDRQFKFLITLGLGQAILYASKEVSFIYIAIFGSFMTLYFIARLLDVRWESRTWRWVFVGALVALLLFGFAAGAVQVLQGQSEGAVEAGTSPPPDPNAPAVTVADGAHLSTLMAVLLGGAALALVAAIVAVVVGQWRRLRTFPELDVIMTTGTLILPSLTPFLIQFAGFNPMDTSPQGVGVTAMFAVPVFVIAVLLGLAYFMRPPGPSRVRLPEAPSDADLARLPGEYDPRTNTVSVQPDVVDWLTALFSSRWWAIGGPYWLFFVFVFTTMFTNGNGIGTGLIGSLGYWLEQQDVQRGNQPWYYYIMVLVPMYEFLPLILSAVAGALGLRHWARSARRKPDVADAVDTADPEDTAVSRSAAARREPLDPAAPLHFPVLVFAGYWAVMNFVAYSLAGEKMPWLTTHLTTPMILLAGWVTGRLIHGVEWRRLWQRSGWVLLVLIPVLAAALARAFGPACRLWEANPLCNTVIPESYQQGVLAGRTVEALAATGVWLAALLGSVGVLAGVAHYVGRVGRGLFWRLVALFAVGWLSFLTVRSAWLASFINYDEATEFLVYAHSTGAVKDVMRRVEEMSLKTTDGYGLRVAYDNAVSWPYSWYLRDYYNAIYMGEEVSRGVIGDAPVIIVGPDKWPQVEAITGDRYYQFEYIRMWWPMQDYFGYDKPADLLAMLGDVAQDPDLQRGLWEIFTDRSYEAYADAVAAYRGGNRPSFELSQWPVPDRMRVYIRRDLFTQVWDYGVAASEIAEATDPYAENELALQPAAEFGAGVLSRPHDIAQGEDGLLYVADSANHRIVVFDEAGNVINSMGRYGLASDAGGGEGTLNEPWGVAAGPDGSVFVADTWNHRVVVFDAQGEFVRTWGSEGAFSEDPMAFWGPRDIAVDADGQVYVADTGNKRVLVFTPEGEFVRQIGEAGVLEGQFEEPVGLAFDAEGNLYIADTWNRRVQVLTPEGDYLREWPIEGWFAQTNERPYLDVAPGGTVLVADPEGSRVIAFDEAGTYRYSFGDVSTVGIIGGVAADSEGSLLVVDTNNGVVRRFNPAQTGGLEPIEPAGEGNG